MNNSSYGFNATENLSSEDKLLEEFYLRGYVCIEGFLNIQQIESLKKDVHTICKAQESEFGVDNITRINELNMARALLCYSDNYLKLAAMPEALRIVKKILGSYVVLHLQNGIINPPKIGHHQNAWHRDLPYQNWTSSEPLACNAYYCLDDFTNENGPTMFLPHSHLFAQAPSAEYMDKYGQAVTTKAGSLIIFNSMLFHKAGNNTSTAARIGINHVYTKAIIRQQIDLPRALQGKYADDPELSVLLGYDSQSAETVSSFRERRLDKLKK